MPQNSVSLRRRWGYRYLRIRDNRHLEFVIAGLPGRALYTPCFDKRGDGTRAVFMIALDGKKRHYGIVVQHYREGFEFDDHTDGVAENKILTILLRKPKEGGEFSIVGPLKSWLFGRVWAFDGGSNPHSVSKITKGSRTVMMFQWGRWRINKDEATETVRGRVNSWLSKKVRRLMRAAQS